MALSERERKLLEEMERNLIEEDASFANRVREVGSSNKNGRKLVLGVVVTTASSNFRLPSAPRSAKEPGGPSYFEDRWNQRFNND